MILGVPLGVEVGDDRAGADLREPGVSDGSSSTDNKAYE
jgi:hypothetical protein